MMIDAISPDCLMAQGIESNDVPIIVFQMAKLYDEIRINFEVGSIGCYEVLSNDNKRKFTLKRLILSKLKCNFM